MMIAAEGSRGRLAGWLYGALVLAVLAGCNRGGGESDAGANGSHAAGSGNKGTKRIIILTNGTSPYWDAAATGAMDAARDLKVQYDDLQVVVDRNDFSVQGQIDKLKQYANSTDVVAVGISVTDSENPSLAEEMRRLQKSGIKVVAIDADVDRSKASDARFAYIGTDNVVAGRELGKALRGLLPDGGTYATFVGLKGASNAKERIAGVAEGAGEGFEQLESLGDGGDPDVARKNVRDALDRNPDLDALIGIWSYNGPAIVDTAKQLDVLAKIKVLAFDAEPITIRQMADGSVHAMVVQNPYEIGYEGVRLLHALVKDDQQTIDQMFPDRSAEGGDIYTTGLRVVVPGEDSPLTKDLFDEQTEFLTLGEFKAWLQKHGLTGS